MFFFCSYPLHTSVCVCECVFALQPRMCVRIPGKGDVSYMFTDSFMGSVAQRGEQDYGKGNAYTHRHTRAGCCPRSYSQVRSKVQRSYDEQEQAGARLTHLQLTRVESWVVDGQEGVEFGRPAAALQGPESCSGLETDSSRSVWSRSLISSLLRGFIYHFMLTGLCHCDTSTWEVVVLLIEQQPMHQQLLTAVSHLTPNINFLYSRLQSLLWI